MMRSESWRRLPTRRLIAVMDREELAGNLELVEAMEEELSARFYETDENLGRTDESLDAPWWESR